jgi:hypothetical protein
MKLIYCKECQDVVRLQFYTRRCKCKKCKGWYLADGLNAVISGPCIPIGFANSFFMAAISNQPEEAPGKVFEAFVIEKNCPTIKVKK